MKESLTINLIDCDDFFIGVPTHYNFYQRGVWLRKHVGTEFEQIEASEWQYLQIVSPLMEGIKMLEPERLTPKKLEPNGSISELMSMKLNISFLLIPCT